ncbi:DUF3575 domain-containing protein [Massilibacteroides vaginae]|uniref:DUF3575 domain-containing protein n=1 Tax=Massilibacteroides vaginae TaxID=1673718 RepID=UPI000A1CA44B|nr:DUF3575 domain-containing protein [Massilibacteroides vaginae]
MRHLIFVFSILSIFQAYSQEPKAFEPLTSSLGMKTNLIYDATTSLNLGAEIKVGGQYTLDISANYNPWTFSDNKKFKHVMIQPELRYWVCEPFNGHFWGVHAMYSHYNIGGIKLPLVSKQKLEDTRYQGNLLGLGISYGYQWYLAPRWNLEATIGIGYAYLDYDAYDCRTCGEKLYEKNRHYVGPTKLGLSLIYIIK